MDGKQKILIVDDDSSIAELISLYLMKEKYQTEIAEDGEEALKIFDRFKPDLLILDLMLPGIDGYEVCKQIRKSSMVPVIILSAKGETFDKVLGLEIGADDYMVKPFDSKELVARVRAVLRRKQGSDESKANDAGSECVEYENIKVNKSSYTVTYCGKNVDMPPKELELLYFLMSNPNKVFTRDTLLDRIWGYDYVGETRTVDVHVKRLREKIKDCASWALVTVYGVGYKFEVNE